MTLANLQPANTQKAKLNASNVFKRFLLEHNVDMRDVSTAVLNDPSGSILVSLLDRFGVHLAFQVTKAGEKLASNTVIQYFRQAKMWLIDCYPQTSAHVEKALLKKGGMLDRYCKTRLQGSLVKQPNGCTKHDEFINSIYILKCNLAK